MVGQPSSTSRDDHRRAHLSPRRAPASHFVSRGASGHDVEIAVTFTPTQPVGSTQVLVDGDDADLVAPARLLALLDALRDRLDVYTADYRRAMSDDDDQPEPEPNEHDAPPAGGSDRPASGTSMTWNEADALAYHEEDRWPSDLLDLNSDGMAA